MYVTLTIICVMTASLGAAMCVGSMMARLDCRSEDEMQRQGRWPTQTVMLSGSIVFAASVCGLSFLWA